LFGFDMLSPVTWLAHYWPPVAWLEALQSDTR
jgi:hypothetical protein